MIRESARCRLCRARHNRHRFAVQTLLRWYRAGDDVERRLPLLSTYLGHVQVADTYWYLTACPELMGAAVQRLEARWEGPR
jgi:integrase/recombinase XerD